MKPWLDRVLDAFITALFVVGIILTMIIFTSCALNWAWQR